MAAAISNVARETVNVDVANGGKPKTNTSEDGKLATLLKTSLHETVRKYLQSVRFSLFSKQYMPIYKCHPNELKDIHQQLVSQLEGNIKQEIDLMYQEENVILLLNNLDKMKAEADKQKGWRPSGSPLVDLQDRFYPIKMKHKKELVEMLAEEMTENENLIKQISKNKKELQELMKQMSSEIKEFNEVTTLISCLPFQKLEETINSGLESMHCSS